MAEIHVLPGVARTDLVDDCSPKDCLKNAMDAGLIDVVIVGRDQAGDVGVWGSNSDADKAIGLLTRGVNFLAAVQQITDEEEIGL